MKKYKVFGSDSNYGIFEKIFDSKDCAYEFYMHMQENADYICIEEFEAQKER